MSATSDLIKLRAAKTAPVQPGQWHADFSTVKKYSDEKGIPIFAVWSNGDLCGHCVDLEECFLNAKFKNWAKTSGVALWIGFGSDTSQEDKLGGTGYTFAWGPRKSLKYFPFVRLYWAKGGVDICKTGSAWDGNSGNTKGAEKLVKALQDALKNYHPVNSQNSTPASPYKIRFNEKLTVKKVNAILDAIDKNEGYCPCQVGKTEDTKCHCKDFTENKGIGEPCICKIYVKQKADKVQIAKGNSRRVATKVKETNKKRR